eukprot:c21046_g2_i1 orf=1-588(-)
MQNSSGCDGSVHLQGASVMLPMQTSMEHLSFASNELPLAKKASPHCLPVLSSRSHLAVSEQCRLGSIRCTAKAAIALARHGDHQARFWDIFNGSVKWHCDRVPFGFSCSSLEAFGRHYENGKPDTGDDKGQSEITGEKKQKRVLILMSDTGGGHRASAEAIKAAFGLEYGDKYQVSVTDLWTDHTPWPFNQLPKSY